MGLLRGLGALDGAEDMQKVGGFLSFYGHPSSYGGALEALDRLRVVYRLVSTLELELE